MYYSMLIYSRRSIKYYLDNPQLFWDTINDLGSRQDDSYVRGLDNAIVGTLEFYKEEYARYPDFLKKSLTGFVKYYKYFSKYSDTATAHINEIEQLLRGEKRLYELESKTIEDPEERLEELKLVPGSARAKEEVEAIEAKHEKFYGEGIELPEEDIKKKIMIVGDDPLLKRQDHVYGIGKLYNIRKDQFVFYTDYEAIKNKGAEIVKKTQYSQDYIGVIFGSAPHSTSGNGHYSSLLARLQQDDGFPIAIKAETNSNSGKPRITKTSLTNALRNLITQYLMAKG